MTFFSYGFRIHFRFSQSVFRHDFSANLIYCLRNIATVSPSSYSENPSTTMPHSRPFWTSLTSSWKWRKLVIAPSWRVSSLRMMRAHEDRVTLPFWIYMPAIFTLRPSGNTARTSAVPSSITLYSVTDIPFNTNSISKIR